VSILSQQQTSHPIESVETVVSLEQVIEIQRAVREVFVHESVQGYIVDLVRATRESSLLLTGSSPRGSLHLMRAAQAHAAFEGAEFVRPDDVKAMASAVLAHRCLPRAELRARGQTTDDVVVEITKVVPAPVPVG
jgi:MoxR-like ATPase